MGTVYSTVPGTGYCALVDILDSGRPRLVTLAHRKPMRNLLGRLHARPLPELLRMADSWAVPAMGESKSDIVAALYRAMTDPRAMRDLWQQFTPQEQALAAFLA